MKFACVACLVVSVVAMMVGAEAPAASTTQLVGVVVGIVLFNVGAVLMLVAAAGEPPVWSDVDPWGSDDV